MDRMASIELALKNEQTEMDFYLHEAARSRNALARAMFENLARDEQEHMTRIRALHERLLIDGAWPEDVPIEVAGTDVKQTLERLVGQEGSQADHDDDDIQAIQKAIDFESRGSSFYAELAGQCKNPAEERFFRFLSQIEREHFLSLTDSLAYLDDPEAWMMQHERSGLDGA
ncbi:MAG: ferritin family protein [Deltaproteobacteria bacterium]|nr:ferritin family protein [Deltaproteobacteria bacterium]